MSRLRAIAVSAMVLSLSLGASPALASSFRTAEILTRDGVVLKGNVFTPDTPGPHPAIVFITSWGLPNIEYLVQASQFADAGYVVLSYTPRGFYTSGGNIETAGPKDIGDVSDAIDWLLTYTPADPSRIGAAGVSYGAGISLLGAAFDSRIRAVAAMSAWTDLLYSLFANQTRHLQAAGLLKLAADLTGRPSQELQQTLSDYFGNRNIPGVTAFAQARGAATYIDRINANRPAILIANAYGDSLFSPNQLADFYNRLTVPRRLELRPGDHAIPELTGILGIPNDAWTSTHRWFDQYLRGVNTGIAAENPIHLQLRGQSGYESYPSWSAISTSTARYNLGEVHWWNGEGELVSGSQTGWSWTIAAGADTPANGGVVLLTNGAEALTGEPPTAWIPAVSGATAGLWQSDWLSSARRLRGAAHLRLTVTPGSSGQTTIIAYLYDTDWSGTGHLVTHAAVTLRGAVAGQAYTVDTDFPATAYDVPSGNRLSLVIDTVDPLYADQAAPFTSVKFSSPASNPSYVSLPLK
ncbi:CocE/NonD family hydrolase [Vitiosangium sp. GDMCC 1.1324]|uniref:CocE/NonD family hydrolase n=1 Tax=Vitiosangium sp. (strain GDMCC 1.1324) TaxID=2138576 RepID=UPI000D393DCB|nr:CocE/NonD family hydrolase [Vitiosangium sp. GDMCC 1.1324]PTL77697.1 acyl esterase [Vitiosangium sp. GDMCC 1.1324]